ncbi:protein of unknown function (plasmid) [Ralstonia solanacearum PSI07]|nr:protein of unknown function [Ralstonia solanacearum PSI07]
MGAEQQDPCLRHQASQPLQQVQAVGLRITFEFVVAQKYVDWVLDQLFQQLLNRFAGEYDFDVRVILEHAGRAKEDDRMVVCDAYLDSGHVSPAFRLVTCTRRHDTPVNLAGGRISRK